jgi:transposase-like protein
MTSEGERRLGEDLCYHCPMTTRPKNCPLCGSFLRKPHPDVQSMECPKCRGQYEAGR